MLFEKSCHLWLNQPFRLTIQRKQEQRYFTVQFVVVPSLFATVESNDLEGRLHQLFHLLTHVQLERVISVLGRAELFLHYILVNI